jgi:hypothetical protein
MFGWALSAVIIVSLVVVGCGALLAPRLSGALYGIVLDDQRAASPGSPAHAMDTRVLHAMGAVGLALAGGLLLAGY